VTLPDSRATTVQDGAAAVAPENVRSVAAIGDSITKGFNGRSALICPNTDQEQYNWATSNTNRSAFCNNGAEGVFSLTERLKCLQNAEVFSPTPNQGKSGADMLSDFVQQANAVKNYLGLQPAPRLTAVLLGHNDICSGKILKNQSSCPAGSDQDPGNYCQTSPAAFEREFRKGLDILIGVPETTVGVASLVRLSQLCNFAGKQNCQLFTSCEVVWRTFTGLDIVFGNDSGICGSLTSTCSSGRVSDNYETARGYRNILRNVTAEYALIPVGGRSNVVVVGGQTVGGATKAPGNALVYSDASWMYKFTSNEVSCCDCFHPSGAGQSRLAQLAVNGLKCTPETPCCRDTGNSARDGRCLDTDTSGTFYPGFFGNSGFNLQ
jgi:lysophospholipase L1-like esterase